jgi:hypothetical protein
MRLSAVASSTAATALLLASAASAGLWLHLAPSIARPGDTVHARAVTPCGACGPTALMALYRNGSAWTAVTASTQLRVKRPFGRVSFRTFSIVVPKGWMWRAFPGFEGTGAEFLNWSLAGRHGFSPDAAMPPGAFILWVNPLGEYGSVTEPTIQRSDFMRVNDPARPRGHARADHTYCAHSGRCFDITLEYGGTHVPEHDLVAVNGALATIRAVPLPRP